MVESAVALSICKKLTGLILATISEAPWFVDRNANGRFRALQTLSLDRGEGLLIKGALLDRFLACMKPASIT
jgi:hypothetical protein